MLNVYLIGVFVWVILLVLAVGYATAKELDDIPSFLEVLIVAAVWPLSIPFMVGAYLGSRK